jgi:replicative DNA helicase
MGKTAFALNIARNVGMRVRDPHQAVAVFSLEMSKEQLALRMLCAEARIDSSRLRRGYLDKQEWGRLVNAANDLSDVPVFIDDSPGLSALDIRAKARRLQAEHGLSLMVIDYLQLLRGRGRVENRQQEISEISRSLKALAKELKVPVVALSQLSRAVEQRGDRIPQLADLRESGAIEQDADVIVFIYRDEVYNKESTQKGIAKIIVGKQRNGPTGEVDLAFLKEYARFETLEKRRDPL